MKPVITPYISAAPGPQECFNSIHPSRPVPLLRPHAQLKPPTVPPTPRAPAAATAASFASGATYPSLPPPPPPRPVPPVLRAGCPPQDSLPRPDKCLNPCGAFFAGCAARCGCGWDAASSTQAPAPLVLSLWSLSVSPLAEGDPGICAIGGRVPREAPGRWVPPFSARYAAATAAAAAADSDGWAASAGGGKRPPCTRPRCAEEPTLTRTAPTFSAPAARGENIRGWVQSSRPPLDDDIRAPPSRSPQASFGSEDGDDACREVLRSGVFAFEQEAG